MRRYEVDLLPIASDDICEIYLYIAADSPESGVRMAEKILDRIDTLADFPLAGRIVPDTELAKGGYRMLLIDSYVAFYRVIDDKVVVYRVLHGARDYPHLLD